MNSYTYLLKLVLLLVGLGLATHIVAQDCSPEECLWPGDANRNGICNNMDFLWIGLANQDIIGGSEREDASISWTPQLPAPDWEGFHPVSGINHKYADTDGNGWIAGADYELFPAVYGQVNDQFTSFFGHEILGGDLFLVPSNPNPAPGETVEISIRLGSEDNPINDIYGIAFTIDFDTSIIKENLTNFSNEGGWMNDIPGSLMTFSKQDELAGVFKPEFAYVKYGGASVSGFGEICKMSIVIEDVIIGIDGLPVDSVALEMTFKRVLGMNAQEEDMLITINQMNLMVTETHKVQNPTPNINILYQSEAQRVFIKSDSEILNIVMINMAGQTMYQRNPKDTELEIFTSGLPAGIYFIQIQTKEGRFIHKIPLIASG